MNDKRASSAGNPLRHDIQGLRGFAVLLVVLYHAGFPPLRGGFIGVDVFFVISGYLITGLLVREWSREGRIDYVDFIARRARRLLPASLMLILFVALAANWVYPDAERIETLAAARAAALYIANVFFAFDAIDYLGGNGKENPLLHMWSLGVEEQFYLVWPPLIALSVRGMDARLGHARLVKMTTAVTACSFVACLVVTWKSQPWAFFGMPLRAWEFGLGALVMLSSQRLKSLSTKVNRVLGAFGTLGILAAATLLDDKSLFPGAWAMLPAVGTALVLASLQTNRGGTLKRCLTVPPLVRIGDVSYSWYLWHWPLLVMSYALWPDLAPAAVVAVVVLSYVAAEASYLWVEQPIRVGSATRLAPRIAVGSAAAATVTAAAALTAGQLHLRDVPSNTMQRAFSLASKDIPIVYERECHVPIRATQPRYCEFGIGTTRRSLLLFGDSHAAHWVPALEEAARRKGWRLISMTKSGCPWVDTPIQIGQLHRDYLECDEWRRLALDQIGALRPDLVLLANSHHRTYVSPSEWKEGARKTLGRVATTQAQVIVLSDTIWPGFDVPKCLSRAEHRGANYERVCRFAVYHRQHAVAPIRDAERHATERQAGAAWVDLLPKVCPVDPCPVYSDGVVHYSDQSHMTTAYSRRFATIFEQVLERAIPTTD